MLVESRGAAMPLCGSDLMRLSQARPGGRGLSIDLTVQHPADTLVYYLTRPDSRVRACDTSHRGGCASTNCSTATSDSPTSRILPWRPSGIHSPGDGRVLAPLV